MIAKSIDPEYPLSKSEVAMKCLQVIVRVRDECVVDLHRNVVRVEGCMKGGFVSAGTRVEEVLPHLAVQLCPKRSPIRSKGTKEQVHRLFALGPVLRGPVDREG